MWYFLPITFNLLPRKFYISRVKDRFKLTQALVVDPLYLQHSWTGILEMVIEISLLNIKFRKSYRLQALGNFFKVTSQKKYLSFILIYVCS